MKFKHAELEAQFHFQCEAELKRLLLDFEDVSRKWGLPAPILTCLGRTPEQNKAVGGVAHSLHLWEVDAANPTFPPFSRAADLSCWQYTPEQTAQALMWLRGEIARRGGKRCWELLKHAVQGGAQHIHVGRERETGGPNA